VTAPYPTALTIAGSDSGGGAGIQADLKTFLDHGVFGMSVVTAVTAQNSTGVRRVDPIPVDGVRAQLEAVRDDFDVSVVKLGMLGSAAHVAVVADVLASWSPRPPIVVDPVMVASTGHRLLEPDAERGIVARLLPIATVCTPNLAEAAVLAGGGDVESWALAAPCPVLITGGDGPGAEVVDVLVCGGERRTFAHPRLGSRPFHGTGCTLASAIAADLAHGATLDEAVEEAIAYVQALITRAVWVGSLGRGNPSLPHGHLTAPAPRSGRAPRTSR
jgi:hydroxymethylpyrimidine/phosphomethylpyrimidine kinase